MAVRYSGAVRISVLYRDQGDYRCSVSSPDGRWSGYVRPAPIGFGSGVGYDSPRAYDEIAKSALAFADHDKPGIAEQADFDDQGYVVSRSRGGASRDAGRRIAKRKLDISHGYRPKKGGGARIRAGKSEQSRYGALASDATERGRQAELVGNFSVASVWYGRAAKYWAKAGAPTRARLWKARSKDVKSARKMGTLYRGGAARSRTRSRRRRR